MGKRYGRKTIEGVFRLYFALTLILVCGVMFGMTLFHFPKNIEVPMQIGGALLILIFFDNISMAILRFMIFLCNIRRKKKNE